MTARPTHRAATAGALGALVAGPAAAAAPSGRVVSLNPCLDSLLVALADRRQIAALSHYARDPTASSLPDWARALPITHETAEEVVALRPDLVLTSRHSSLATRNALRRLGVRAEPFSVPDTVADSMAQVRRVARLLGRPERGEALIARVEAALAAAAPPPGARRLKVLVFQPNGFAAGPRTLLDEMLTRTGFDNMAARYGLRTWGNVPLERLIADPPQLLLAGEAAPGPPTWAERVVSHPALKAIGPRMRRAVFPQRLLYCGGPVLLETAAVLADARRKALEAHP